MKTEKCSYCNTVHGEIDENDVVCSRVTRTFPKYLGTNFGNHAEENSAMITHLNRQLVNRDNDLAALTAKFDELLKTYTFAEIDLKKFRNRAKNLEYKIKHDMVPKRR